MRKLIILILILFIITGCASFPKKDDNTLQPDIFRCKSFGSGRGLVVDFIENAPPLQIRDGRTFPVSLKFANHNKDPIEVQYFVQDSTDVFGFDDQGSSLTVEGAEIENNKFYIPGCKIFGENLPEKNFGGFVYRNPEFDETIQFFARIRYDYVALLNGFFCVYNPALTSGFGCSDKETISGEGGLGLSTRYDPVTVTKVEKTITSLGENSVLVNLDIFIENLGKGIVNTEENEVVNFRISSQDDVSFMCSSYNMVDGSREGSNLRVFLDQGKVSINCWTEVYVDRQVKYGFDMELEYPYEYIVRSGPIELKSGRSKQRTGLS